jgi:hypothetical protein
VAEAPAAAPAQPAPAPVAAPQAAPAAAPAPAPVAPPPAVAAEPVADTSKYTVAIPKLTDRDKAKAIVAALGGKATLRDESAKATVFRLISAKSYSPAEAKAVQLKASIFKIDVSVEPQSGGEVKYVFGTFNSQLDAALGGGKVQPLGVPTTVEKKETETVAIYVDVAPALKDEAEKLLATANGAGAKAKLKKVK